MYMDKLCCTASNLLFSSQQQVLTTLANTGLEHRYVCDYDLLTLRHWKVFANVRHQIDSNWLKVVSTCEVAVRVVQIILADH